VASLERGKDTDGCDPRAPTGGAAPGGRERVLELGVHGAEGPAGEQRGPRVDFQVEAVDLEREPFVCHQVEHLLVDQRRLAVGVDQVELELAADRRRPHAEARALEQQRQRPQVELQLLAEARKLLVVETFARDLQAHSKIQANSAPGIRLRAWPMRNAGRIVTQACKTARPRKGAAASVLARDAQARAWPSPAA
jgi:hypothetical protein